MKTVIEEFLSTARIPFSMNGQLSELRLFRNYLPGKTPDDYESDMLLKRGMLFLNTADHRIWMYDGDRWIEIKITEKN
jgi:hypothetical protein